MGKVAVLSATAVAALEGDPFYRSICAPHADLTDRRRATLETYFAYSIEEASELGRCAHLDDPAVGVALWVLPQRAELRERASLHKRTFLRAILAPQGAANHGRIEHFMHRKATTAVDDAAWYLSILAVHPTQQGRGLGRTLLEPTLAEADRARATCYLETFAPRTLPFYERLGFATKARYDEPTTRAAYALMVREPR